MRTIQMTLDDDLVTEVDRVSKELRTNRSAFARKALRDALARCALERLERRHRRGYEQYPVAADEFSGWETEQAWGDK
jgi:metal-responsive CopG/Arc/MetJ family transcriptional regulator